MSEDEARIREAVAQCEVPPRVDALVALTPATGDGPRADCVQCGEPTEYPADHPGLTLCPVCAWQEAQRVACSG
ncbi:hypothetical protein ACIRBX_15550 [Kitasatospora sp. NPDC096147]|uniref:hypothetical protein n=1 Tax=Kitasatospora sp. NPDC096147 TaxID=3364093 RepID=UPI0038294376